MRTSRVAAAVGAVVLAVTAVSAGPAFSQWMGDTGTTIDVRKDVKDLSAAEKRAFVAAVLKLKATPDPKDPSHSWYDTFVLWHKDAFECENAWKQKGNWAGAAHNSPTFLPWHRQYLDEYESALRTVSGDPDLTLPYWDWTDPTSTAAVFSPDFMGGNGDPQQDYAVTDGPFRKGQWRITVKDPLALYDPEHEVAQPSYLARNFGAFAGSTIALPTAREVDESIGVHRFDHAPYDASSPLKTSFRNTLEGWRDAEPASCDKEWVDVTEAEGGDHVLHNAVHIYTGGVWKVGDKVAMGTMAYNTSPNDPVFFIHHANIDRIFAAWELANGQHYRPVSGAPTGWNAQDTMWPWHDRTINSWFGTLRNGYRYDSLPS